MKKVDIVVPIFNEEDCIELFANELALVAKANDQYKFRLIFVNDGSTDGTFSKILEISNTSFEVACLNFTRNFGKEAALTAGLNYSTADAVIPMDVDLQDPPGIISEMLKLWSAGAQIVLARRSRREEDNWLKRNSAEAFYKVMNKLATPPIPENVGDFRLMDRKVVDAVNSLPESNRFMKGIFSWVGFEQVYLDYERTNRRAGGTKFNFAKLWTFGIEGITSFSIRPLKIWTYLGLAVSLASLVFAIYLITRVVFFGVEMPGYASTMVAITLIGGLQLMGIGVLGEYVGRIFLEAKRRPLYLISDVYER